MHQDVQVSDLDRAAHADAAVYGCQRPGLQLLSSRFRAVIIVGGAFSHRTHAIPPASLLARPRDKQANVGRMRARHP